MKRLSYKGYAVWITVDGKEVEHYGVTTDEATNSIRCWIPSENEKPFAVHVRRDPFEYDVSLNVFLDGHPSPGYLFRKGAKWDTSISYTAVSATEVRDFKFGTFDSTDDDAYLEQMTPSQNFGEIKIEIDKAAEIKSRGPTTYCLPPSGKVHERSQKALSHQVKYGESRHSKMPGQITHIRILEKLATFTFLYRPLAILQATSIAPYERTSQQLEEELLPSTSSRPSSKRNYSEVKQESGVEEDEEDEEDEEEILLERLNTFQTSFLIEMEKLRKDIDQVRVKKASKRSRKKVKSEPNADFIPGEIIDLT